MHEKTIRLHIHKKICKGNARCMHINKTIVSCQSLLWFFHSTKLWLPVFWKLAENIVSNWKTWQSMKLLSMHKMLVFIIQLDEIKNINSDCSIMPSAATADIHGVLMFCLKVVCLYQNYIKYKKKQVLYMKFIPYNYFFVT